ncbi:hypothetical protein [Clostridium sp. CF012]|uniref:hypothetical protein n=1 Tax=Clostridium sp. CF012 TaxID=2843319 RepID=UPI001C0BF4B4|nr:hypothetical protein [Clostridium sp. CF012]MBU3145018.1 hypothetical protein [Clostridium sp. CF012]
MRNKLKSFSAILIFTFSFYLLANIAVPVQATTAKVVQAPVKVSASVNSKTPFQNTIVKVTVNGPATSSVKIICHYRTDDATYKDTIASNGKRVIQVKIGNATRKFNVVVDVLVTYKGKIYTTKTSFKPM